MKDSSTKTNQDIWKIDGNSYDLKKRGMIMGIINVTPDSFSDGGLYYSEKDAVSLGVQLIKEGADILDLGGESTRPNADDVSVKEELDRVIPVIRSLRDRSDILLSVDTSKAKVADEAIQAGAHIINDVTGFRNKEMIDVVSKSDVGLVIMHMQGTPRTMQKNPTYKDVISEVSDFFSDRINELLERGVDKERIALDPGFGFGKTLKHNITLGRELSKFHALGRPLLIGVSRKSMITQLLENSEPSNRRAPTVALTSAFRELGAHIFRVHDVKQNEEALRMTEAILSADTK